MTRPTLTDEQYRRTEGVLFRYAKAKVLIGRIEAEIDELDRQIIAIEKQMYAQGLPSVGVANYSGMPAGGSGDTTSVERAVLYREDRQTHLQELHSRKVGTRDERMERLFALREETAPVEYAYQQLEQRDQHIFTQRYFYARPNEAIALQLHCDERTVRRRKSGMIHNLASILETAENAPNLRRVI